VVLVLDPLVRIPTQQVLVGADRKSDPQPVAGIQQPLRVVGTEILVVQVGGDMVPAVSIPAKDTEFQALRPDVVGNLEQAVLV
jgi:hypothetical protein